MIALWYGWFTRTGSNGTKTWLTKEDDIGNFAIVLPRCGSLSVPKSLRACRTNFKTGAWGQLLCVDLSGKH